MTNVYRHGHVFEKVVGSRSTAKAVTHGTHRAKPLDQTIARVLNLAPVMGITRIANVTGLDSIGIPVVMVARPNSRSVTVSQGKGIDLARAKASGLMEAAELYHAETTTLPLRLATYQELCFKYKVVEIRDLPRVAGSHFHPNLRILWCAGHDLLNGEDVLVPYEMVHTNYTTPLPDGHGCFTASSNGLASGNTLIEAISQGICEVIERDAVALWQAGREKRAGGNRLNLKTINDPTCRRIIAKFDRAGLFVAVWDVTTDVKIAGFVCFIVPRDDSSTWHRAVAAGYGCHPCRGIALLRALTEAAQTRLTVISGVRDDFRGETYEELLDPEVVRSKRELITRSVPRRRFADIPTRNNRTFEGDVAWELRCLRRAGVRRVIVIDLTKPEFGLPVVRVIIPGLEPIVGRGYSPGSRARSVIGRKA
jgi:YcaO-like protein with predicted kinase domain